MLYCDSGPTGAWGTESFPGHRAVIQGHTAGPTQAAAGGPPAHPCPSHPQTPAGPLSQAHITWLTNGPLGRGWHGEIKALAPDNLGLNPASAIHWLEPLFLHLYRGQVYCLASS